MKCGEDRRRGPDAERKREQNGEAEGALAEEAAHRDAICVEPVMEHGDGLTTCKRCGCRLGQGAGEKVGMPRPQAMAPRESRGVPVGCPGIFAKKATTIPGSKAPCQGASIPLSLDRTDDRRLIRTRPFRNAVVEKLWIEDDVLYQYGNLDPLLLRIIRALRYEIESKDRGAPPSV